LASYLAGGDSSIILAEAFKHKKFIAFITVFDLPINKSRKHNQDLPYAETMCSDLGVQLIKIPIKFNSTSLLNAIDFMANMLDPPHSMGTALTCFMAAEYISKHYPDIRVVLNGNGAD